MNLLGTIVVIAAALAYPVAVLEILLAAPRSLVTVDGMIPAASKAILLCYLGSSITA